MTKFMERFAAVLTVLFLLMAVVSFFALNSVSRERTQLLGSADPELARILTEHAEANKPFDDTTRIKIEALATERHEKYSTLTDETHRLNGYFEFAIIGSFSCLAITVVSSVVRRRVAKRTLN